MNPRLSRPILARSALALLVAATWGCGGGEAEGGAPADATAGAPALQQAAPTADGAEIRESVNEYVLDMEEVGKLFRAQRSVERLLEENPDLQDEVEAGMGTPEELEAVVDGSPELRAAIEDAGLSTRDYVVGTLALMQAGMVEEAIQSGASEEAVLARTGLSRENLDFVRQHRAEIERMRAAPGDE